MAHFSTNPGLVSEIRQSLSEYKDRLTSELEAVKKAIVADTENRDEKALVQFTTLRAAHKRVTEQIQSLSASDTKPPHPDEKLPLLQPTSSGPLARHDIKRKSVTPNLTSEDSSQTFIGDVPQLPSQVAIEDSQAFQNDPNTIQNDVDQSTPKQMSSRHSNEAMPSCQTCRTRLVKCGREQPACSTCTQAGQECGGYDVQTSSTRSDGSATSPADGNTFLTALETPLSAIPRSDTTGTDSKPLAPVDYCLDDMTLYFPEDDIIYNHIIELNDKAIELNCPLCNANCTTNGKYFNGASSFIGHVRSHGFPDLRSVQEIFERAETKGCLVEVSEDDIERIRLGEQPLTARGPDRGEKRKLLLQQGVKEAQPFDKVRESRTEPKSPAKATPIKKGWAIYKSPNRSALKRPVPIDDDDHDLEDSNSTIAVASRKSAFTATPRKDVLKELASNALALGNANSGIENSGGRGKRQKKRTVHFGDRYEDADWERVIREAEEWDGE